MNSVSWERQIRSAAFLAVLLAATACEPPPPEPEPAAETSAWNVERDPDPMGGPEIISAYTEGTNASIGMVGTPVLSVICTRDGELLTAVDWAGEYVGDEGQEGRIRYDDERAQDLFLVGGTTGTVSFTLFPVFTDFSNRERVAIEAYTLLDGRRLVGVFSLVGASEAIRAPRDACR